MPMSEREPVNILLVDDQPAKLLSYEVILRDLGENLIKAQSGREALERILKNDIAVVLLDVVMPDLDGFELAAMIRDHPRYSQTAIIFVSAISVTEHDRLKGYQHGAVDYIPVPVVPDLLRARVRVFAELYRKTRQLEHLNTDLERRVQERTAALAEMNALLEQRVEERTNEREAALAQVHEMQKMESLGQLTGGLAHDFNNLLMGVMGCLNYLSKKTFDDPRAERFLKAAKESTERGAALTKRLLAFARRQELRPQSIALQQLVPSMLEMLERSLGPAVQIELKIDAKVPSIRADANQLELALLNLCLNARDAMPDGGKLNISAQAMRLEPAAKTGDHNLVRLSVEDNGAGMDEATLKRCTEPFFTTKGLGKGTGLGLSSVHGLAVQSGGRMEIDSMPGRGTRVDLLLPVAEGAEVAEPAAAPAAPALNGHRFSVLVVDDDPLVGTLTVSMLEELGHAATFVLSAAAALPLLRNTEFDLMITDHMMPEMTGAALVEEVRGFKPGLPIILATGYADLPAGRAQQLPRLSKPYSGEELAAVLANVPVLRQVS
jgi:signal transduction histidine kinase